MFSKVIKILVTASALAVSMPGRAQHSSSEAIESITAAELRDHLFFLASDYLKGRYAPTPEYDIASRYVETQFRAAGLEPVSGTNGYFQGVPFNKTVYNDKIHWSIIRNGIEKPMVHKEDFKIVMGNRLDHKKVPMVYLGYGIKEPEHKWDDLKDLNLEGKVVVCLSGAPVKNGKPVLPAVIHEKYAGRRGLFAKVAGGWMVGNPAAVIVVDLDGSYGTPFDQVPSSFSAEKYVYKGDGRPSRMGSFPTVYLVRKEVLNVIMAGNANNPMDNPESVLKNYKTGDLQDTFFDSNIEILSEETIYSNNVIGVVPGTDPVLKNEYIVVGAHLDHVRPVQGEVCNGADDNASGSAGVMEIAEAVAMNPCRRSVVFITYTAEEMGLIGSRFFLGSGLLPKEQVRFNLNMDMIGRSDPKHLEDRAHFVVTDKKYVQELKSFITGINDGVTDFPLIFDNDEDSPGGSDHMTFISAGIPAFFFFSGVHPDLHRPGDDPEKIDYPKALQICKLGYLIVNKLANMDEVPPFTRAGD